MNDILFSIIIPAYNIEAYIEDCVDSIETQACKNFEIIIINDGSTDETANKCERLSQKYSNLHYRTQENGGAACARKTGLALARGQYVLFVDGDDWISSDCLSKLKSIIEKLGVDVICYGMFVEGQKHNCIPYPLSYRQGLYSKENLEKEIYPLLIADEKGNYFSPSLADKCFKKCLCEKYMFVDRRASFGEDGACAIPCVFAANSMYIMKECLYYYRYNPASATKRKRVYNWEIPEIVNTHIQNKLPDNQPNLTEQLYRKIVHDLITVSVSQFNKNKSYFTIRKDIIKNFQREYYKCAIKKAQFRYTSSFYFINMALKIGIAFPLYIINKIKY